MPAYGRTQGEGALLPPFIMGESISLIAMLPGRMDGMGIITPDTFPDE
jgi:hypothetical protein